MNDKPMPCPKRCIKHIGTIVLTFFSLMFSGAAAEAGWFLDAEKFHVSAHGQIACQDCHTDITDRPLHPDPAAVSKQSREFFNPDQCFECHGNVPEDLEQNIHGAQTVEPAESYDNCLDCHNPHQVLLSEGAGGEFDSAKPPAEQCGACHNPETELPAFAEEDENCMTCHRFNGADDPHAAEKIGNLCFHCHANSGTDPQKITAQSIALVTPENYRQTPHATLACTECHPQAASFEHDSQPTADCRQCHLPHDAKTAHDAHSSVACQACHLPGVKPVRDAGTGKILWQRDRLLAAPLNVHEMITINDDDSCQRCHTSGNSVGASAMVLPAKSVLCMICHTSTLSFGDPITAVSLIVFLIGLAMSLLLMFSVSSGLKGSAGLTGKATGAETQGGIETRSLNKVRFVKEIVLNVFFQKRLLVRSPGRWFIHSLLFFPMALRFLWGIVALSASLWRPQWEWVWQMIDKNNGMTALFFDLTGIMIFSGVALALARHFFDRSQRVPGLPRNSRLALYLLGGIVVVGFVVEGMRIAMTGATGSAAYAFLGFGISMMFPDPETLTDAYGYFWYVHALLTGAFFIFLPFSRLLHIILAPVVMALNAATAHD